MAPPISRLCVALGIAGLVLYAMAGLRADLTEDRDTLIRFGDIHINCDGDITSPGLWFYNWAGPWSGPTDGATEATRFNIWRGTVYWNRIVWPNGVVSFGAGLSLWPLFVVSLALLTPLARASVRRRRRAFEVVQSVEAQDVKQA